MTIKASDVLKAAELIGSRSHSRDDLNKLKQTFDADINHVVARIEVYCTGNNVPRMIDVVLVEPQDQADLFEVLCMSHTRAIDLIEDELMNLGVDVSV